MYPLLAFLLTFLIATGFQIPASAYTLSHAIPIQVSFQLDARKLGNIQELGIRGNTAPLSWEKTYPLIDPDGDGIFEATISFAADSDLILEYKYAYGTDPVNWEYDGANRILVIHPQMSPPALETWGIRSLVDINKLPLLPSESLLADLDLAYEVLKQLHPGLYRYQSPEEIEAFFAHYRSVFSHTMSYREAYLHFSSLLVGIQCGHTFTNYYNQSGLIQQVVFDQPDKLPFTFRAIENRMILTNNASQAQELKTGTEILSINGIPVAAIFNALEKYIRSDGNNPYSLTLLLNLTFQL